MITSRRFILTRSSKTIWHPGHDLVGRGGIVERSAQFLSLVEQFVAPKVQPLLRSPATHEPKYHEFSLVDHCLRVIAAAERLVSVTGIDVADEAIWHDVGKLVQINRAQQWRQGIFIGHEVISANIARRRCLPEEICQIIEHHNVSYAHRADRVLPKVCQGDVNVLRRLLVLATADSVGKGWIESQQAQRPEIAEKFHEICRLAEIDGQFPETLAEAILTW